MSIYQSPLERDSDPDRVREAHDWALVRPFAVIAVPVYIVLVTAMAMSKTASEGAGSFALPYAAAVCVPVLWFLGRRWRRSRRAPHIKVQGRFGVGDPDWIAYALGASIIVFGIVVAATAVVNAINGAGQQHRVAFVAEVLSVQLDRDDPRLVLRSSEGLLDLPVPFAEAKRSRPGDRFVATLYRGSLGLHYYKGEAGSLERLGESPFPK